MPNEVCPTCGLVTAEHWSEQLESELRRLEDIWESEKARAMEINAQLAADWREIAGEEMSEDDYYAWRGKARVAYMLSIKKVAKLGTKVRRLREQQNAARLTKRFYQTLRAHGITMEVE